jgi:hypothetical protein
MNATREKKQKQRQKQKRHQGKNKCKDKNLDNPSRLIEGPEGRGSASKEDIPQRLKPRISIAPIRHG